jgi:hypothetical protein
MHRVKDPPTPTRDAAGPAGPIADLRVCRAPYTSLQFSKRPPGLGSLQRPGVQLRPPALSFHGMTKNCSYGNLGVYNIVVNCNLLAMQ